MSFGNPAAFALLLIVFGLTAIDIIRQSSVSTRWPRVGRLWAGRQEIDLVTPGAKPRPRWCLWIGLALLVVALAEPRYGKADLAVDEQPREEPVVDEPVALAGVDRRPDLFLIVAAALESLPELQFGQPALREHAEGGKPRRRPRTCALRLPLIRLPKHPRQRAGRARSSSSPL